MLRIKRIPPMRAALVAGVAAVVLPISYSGGQGLHESRACGGPACCMEFNSVCDYAGTVTYDYYLAIGGKCGHQQGPQNP